MKRLYIYLFAICVVLFFSCKSNDVQPVEEVTTEIEEDEVMFIDEDVDSEIIFEEEDEPEVIEDDGIDDAEFLRSTDKLPVEETVTKQEFSDDKSEILRIIADLSKIMEKQDTQKWLSYLDPESINFYSNPTNIRKVQKKLPDKTIQLHGIGDYFKYVFIPSRKQSEVDEIRYISKTNIKAVKVKDDNSINVYYYFVKIEGKWLVHIPTI